MKANLLNLGIVILMAAATSACSPGFAPVEDMDSGVLTSSSLEEGLQLKSDYQRVQDQGVQAATVEPLSPIDATGLTDDQVVQALKDRLLGNLDKMKKAIDNAKAAGRDVSRTETIYAQAEAHTEAFIDKLDNDADFRAKVIAQVRKGKPEGANGTPARPVEVKEFDAQICSAIKKAIDNPNVIAQVRDGMKKTYDTKCSGAK